MKRTVWLWQLFGFAFTALGGTLLHFLFDLTGGSLWAAPFSGVNESTWEHMKLMLWPMLIFAVVQSFFFKDYRNFWCVKLRGTLLGLWLIPIFYYTYNGIIGKSSDWINITIFFLSAAIAYAYEAVKLNNNGIAADEIGIRARAEGSGDGRRQVGGAGADCASPRRAFIALCAIALLFVLFTFATPGLGIFKDPITGTFGI